MRLDRGWLLGLLAAWAACSGAGLPCDMNVRQAGWVTQQGEPCQPQAFMLRYLCRQATPEDEAHAKRISDWAQTEGLNLEVSVVGVDRLSPTMLKVLEKDGVDLTHLPLSQLLHPSGERGLHLARPGWLNEAALRALACSPRKVQLRARLEAARHAAVVLFDPGSDPATGSRARAEIEAAVASHEKAFPGQALALLALDRTQESEAFLCRELGIDGRDGAPCAVIVFGKGRVLRPLFRGPEIRREALRARLAFLEKNASDCGADPVFVGRESLDLFFSWPREMDHAALARIAREPGVKEVLRERILGYLGTRSGNVDPARGVPAHFLAEESELPELRAALGVEEGRWPAWIWLGGGLGVMGVWALLGTWLVLSKRRTVW